MASQPGNEFREPAVQGFVQVNSIPPGAEIFVSSEFVGKTPLNLPLVPGKYVLTAEFKERTSRPRPVTVTADGTSQVSFDFRTGSGSTGRTVRRPKKKVDESPLTKIGRSIRNIFTTDEPKKR